MGLPDKSKDEFAQIVVGHSMTPTSMYPERFRVETFPTGEELAAMGNELQE